MVIFLYLIIRNFEGMAGVHIGSIIKDHLRVKKISVDDFADEIGCTGRNAYRIFEKKSIDTEVLVKISKFLKRNFFLEYISADDIIEHPINIADKSEMTSMLLDAIKERKALEQKYAALTGKSKSGKTFQVNERDHPELSKALKKGVKKTPVKKSKAA